MGGLQGYEMPEGDTLAIGIPESSCVWQFIPQAGSDRFVLRNVADSVFLYAKFPAATGLAVHEKEKLNGRFPNQTVSSPSTTRIRPTGIWAFTLEVSRNSAITRNMKSSI